MRSRQVLAAALAVPGVGFVGFWLYGFSRPVEHVATMTRTVSAPPEAVWALVDGFDQQESWRTGVTDVRRIGDRIEEEDERGDVLAFTVDEERPPERLVTRIVDQTTFSGTWTITLGPDGSGTWVEIVERGAIPSPFVRAVAAVFMDPTAGGTRYLDDLQRRCNSSDGIGVRR